MSARFRVGVSADFQTDGAGVLDPILAAQFGPLPAVEYEFMPQAMPEVRPDHIQAYDTS